MLYLQPLRQVFNPKSMVAVAVATMMFLALGRIHMRAQTTLIGYELGDLKRNESTLLEKHSFLQMRFAKLTARNHLELMAEGSAIGESGRTLASR